MCLVFQFCASCSRTMACLPNSFAMCLHAFSNEFPERLLEFQVTMVCVVCLRVACSKLPSVSGVGVPVFLFWLVSCPWGVSCSWSFSGGLLELPVLGLGFVLQCWVGSFLPWLVVVLFGGFGWVCLGSCVV